MRSALLSVAADNTNKVHLTPQTRIVAAVIALAFMLMILELIRRDRLQERYSVNLAAGRGRMLAGAAFPGLLELLANVDGRPRTPNVALFSVVLLLLLGLALNQRVMSRQARPDHPAGAGNWRWRRRGRAARVGGVRRGPGGGRQGRREAE